MDGETLTHKAMTFAPEHSVSAMRDLLLQHSAVETEDDKQRWTLRQATDIHERHRFHCRKCKTGFVGKATPDRHIRARRTNSFCCRKTSPYKNFIAETCK